MPKPALSKYAPGLYGLYMQIATMHNDQIALVQLVELPKSNFIRD